MNHKVTLYFDIAENLKTAKVLAQASLPGSRGSKLFTKNVDPFLQRMTEPVKGTFYFFVDTVYLYLFLPELSLEIANKKRYVLSFFVAFVEYDATLS